jgi:methionyl-tRNA synthetase
VARFYITTGIDYVNGRPHQGHAYEKIAADVIARYHRLKGDDVRLVVGNDEHSQNVFKKAREQGLEPLAYCDLMEREWRSVWDRLHISYDDFIRTSEPRHKRAVQALVRTSFEKGDIYEGVYEGWYCVSCEEFKPEKSLVDGLCPIHRTKPEWIKEKNYFFRLSKYAPALLDHYERHPAFVEPSSRRNEMLSLIHGGLEDISVSRAGQAWGVPLPFADQGVVYVWYDALINYITSVGYATDEALFDRWWMHGDTRLHVVGKDITRFHCVVWPAMLMSAGIALPTQVFGHGWVLYQGQKMSKSLGTVINPLDAIDRVGADPLRWYLTREIVFGQDGDFSWELFEKSYNADLANNLGNLVNRVTSMADRYRGGTLQGPGTVPDALAAFRESAIERYQTAMNRFDLSGGATAALSFVDQANEHIAREEPWKLAKAGADRALDAVLWNAAEALRIGAVLLSPFMPASSADILRRIGRPAGATGPSLHDTAWHVDGARSLQQGGLMWPRLEPRENAPVVAVTGNAPTSPSESKESSVTEETSPAPTDATPAPDASAPASPWPLDQRITIDEFMKIDLRVARVLAAERVPNSKKLMKLEIDLGVEKRTLVAGIAEAYDADALVGRLVAIVANLKPAKLMGIESNGMVLAASPEGGRPMLVSFDEPPPPGSRVR